MRVQRMLMPGSEAESWTLLGDDHGPVEPAERFLAYLAAVERSPNTVKAYAHDLKDWFMFLGNRGVAWQSVTVEEVAGFVAWLRLPPAARDGRVAALPTADHHCTASSVTRKLAFGEAFELAFQPALEGGAPVIDQHAHLLEHLGGPFDAEVPGPQCREDLGVADRVAGGVPGQYDDQRPADTQADPAFPAARLTPPVGQIGRPDEPRVLQVGVAVLVETGEVLAGFEQPRLEPSDGGTRGGRRRRFAWSAPPVVLTGRALGSAALHPVEEQLVAAERAGLQNRDRSSG